MKEQHFKTEADLCAAFIAWATKQRARCFAEWAGWDILVAFEDGYQLGVQAKLRLNAEVIEQASPNVYGYHDDFQAPDFRAVLVPQRLNRTWHAIAERLGLVVFEAGVYSGFNPQLTRRGWLDWNPAKRHDLPPVATDSVAGSPCPVTLTDWKLCALDVLAEMEVRGTITTKRMRELGVHPGRWTTGCWLMPAETRGLWVRGERCPKFDEQHPTAYAAALAKARRGEPPA